MVWVKIGMLNGNTTNFLTLWSVFVGLGEYYCICGKSSTNPGAYISHNATFPQCWVTSLEAIYQMTYGFLCRIKGFILTNEFKWCCMCDMHKICYLSWNNKWHINVKKMSRDYCRMSEDTRVWFICHLVIPRWGVFCLCTARLFTVSR